MKKYLIIVLVLLLMTTNTYSLKILEPLTKDITYFEEVDLGYFSANEFFMISFLLEGDEDYKNIKVDPSQIKDVIVEPTKSTSESIFTVIKINDNLKGDYNLKLILESETRKKEIILKMNICIKHYK